MAWIAALGSGVASGATGGAVGASGATGLAGTIGTTIGQTAMSQGMSSLASSNQPRNSMVGAQLIPRQTGGQKQVSATGNNSIYSLLAPPDYNNRRGY